MNGVEIQEMLERVPLKRKGFRRILLSLVERTTLEHRLERTEENGHNCKDAQLIGIATLGDLNDIKLGKDLLNLGRGVFTGVTMMWYNIHDISPTFVSWTSGHFHYTKRR